MPRSPDRILDELLVLKCQAGDVDALKSLVQRWHARLRCHAWYLTQDTEASDDVVQDAWVDIIQSLPKLNQPASFRAWAYRIVANRATDWIRRESRTRRVRREVAERQKHKTSNTKVAEPDAHMLVRRAIRLLPIGTQQLLSMKYLDRMSVREIAAALNIPVGTVKSRLHHARSHLKHKLERTNHERD